MQRKQAGLYQASEFARLAGVTVRTLHHYDELDVLKPSSHTESGYRLYGDADLAKLQQISTLRFIGLPLKDIKEILSGRRFELAHALRLQREMLVEKRRQLDAIVDAIERAEHSLDRDSSEQFAALRRIMETMTLEQDWEWVKQKYTPEQLERLAKRYDPAMQEQWSNEWAALLADVESAKHEDPASELAQAIAARWHKLIFAFTNGEPDIEQSLRNVYSDTQAQPKGFKVPLGGEAGSFMNKAMEIYKSKSPQ